MIEQFEFDLSPTRPTRVLRRLLSRFRESDWQFAGEVRAAERQRQVREKERERLLRREEVIRSGLLT